MPLILGAVLTWMADFLGKKTANITFRIGVFLLLIIATKLLLDTFFHAIYISLDAINVTVPELMKMLWSWFVPSTAKNFFIAIIAARIARFVLVLTYQSLNTKAKAIMHE